MYRDAQGRIISEDGQWYWNGRAWFRTDRTREQTSPPPPAPRNSRFGGSDAIPPHPTVVIERMKAVAQANAAAGAVSEAGPWVRLGAYLVDSVILSMLQLLFVGLFVFLSLTFRLVSVKAGDLSQVYSLLLPLELLLAFVQVGYFAFLWSSGGTIGMRMFKLHIVDEKAGTAISAGKAMVRYIVMMLAVGIFAPVLLVPLFDSRKRGIHDLIMGTLVIRLR